MIGELFFGIGIFVLGLLVGDFAIAILGLFFVLIVLVEVVPAWIRYELRLFRAVTRHDFDHVGLERVDDRRAA